MVWRLVVGKVHKTNDTPWVNTAVIFRRQIGSYTSEVQYPPDALTFATDAFGNLVSVDSSGNASLGCKLWVNEEGDKISNYECIVGKDRFSFSLPIGDGSPIQLSFLRAGSAPVESYPQSIIDYVDASIAVATGQSNYYKSFNAIPTQNSYQLDAVSLAPDKSKVYFNGAKQRYAFDYNINSTTLNLLFNLPHPFTLEIYY